MDQELESQLVTWVSETSAALRWNLNEYPVEQNRANQSVGKIAYELADRVTGEEEFRPLLTHLDRQGNHPK